MNRLLFFISFLVLASWPKNSEGQEKDSSLHIVQWTFSGSNQNDTQALIKLSGKIRPGWKLFSTTMPEDSPNSRVLIDTLAKETLISIDEERKPLQKKFAALDQAELLFFENEVEWQVKISGDLKKENRGTVLFMVNKGDSFPNYDSASFLFSLGADGKFKIRSGDLQESPDQAQNLKLASIDLAHPVNSCGGTGVESGKSKGLWSIFFLGFLGGLIALLTPCVFPMIPLTVSFFTKQSTNKKKGILNATLYGFFIFLIYTLLSLPFYFLDSLNPEILNNISTNVWLNIFFFIVFVVFALSFFGLFEITLPGSLANSVDSKASTGSLLGIFFMALTLALVSFSCTGTNPWLFVSRISVQSGWRISTYMRNGRFWPCPGTSICFVCIVSQFAPFSSKIRWLAEFH